MISSYSYRDVIENRSNENVRDFLNFPSFRGYIGVLITICNDADLHYYVSVLILRSGIKKVGQGTFLLPSPFSSRLLADIQ